jgi:hypothetical protein
MPLTLEKLVSYETWQKILTAVDPVTMFHDHVTTFKGSQPVNIPEELQKILDQC